MGATGGVGDLKQVDGEGGAGALSALTVTGELDRYQARDLTSSYKKRLASHGLVPQENTPHWRLPAGSEIRITNAALETYGDPSTFGVSALGGHRPNPKP